MVGFLHGEGLIRKATDVSSIAYCDGVDDEDAQENVIEVKLLDGLPHDFERRRFPVGSSCGVCGRRAIDDLVRNIVPIRSRVEIDPMQLSRMELQFTEGQRLFARTGGLHAAALFDGGGGLLELREDVGRHNAVDKIIGSSILKGTLPLSDHSLMVSGRVSFEIIEKCVRAGCGLLAAVSAPSTLAVDLARRARLTLVAFLRKGRFTVYSDPTVSYDLG